MLSLLLMIAAPDAPYRALGTEPFWSVEIEARTITYRPATGASVTVPKPAAITGINGESYRTPRLTVDVTHVTCSDGMSDRVYPDTVRVVVDGRRLEGCGDATPAGSMLADTRWTIDMIDGRRLALPRGTSLAFSADRLMGRICNSFSGDYRLAKGTLTAGPIAATRMACNGPAGTAEAAVLKALARPLKVHRGSNAIVLADARTKITLRRVR